MLMPDSLLEANPSQLPLVRGGAIYALPLSRGSGRGFGSSGQSGLKRQKSQCGFTLIELLVALVILAVISVAGYRSLDAVLQTRERVAAETRKWQHLAFFFARLNQDLAQVVQRPVRNQDGVIVLAAMIGNLVTVGEDDAELIFTRAGIPDQGAALQAPQRIGYRLDQGNIVMLRWPTLDQAPRVKPVRYPVLEGVRDFKLRYLDKSRIWQLQWQYPTLPNNLPLAIEVTLTLTSDEVITRIFALQ
jgi:general secretion pathway protein J